MRSLQDHFLIAMPAMEDPNFNATVTYLCKHDAEGALGVVINRPSETTLGDVLAQFSLTPSERARARQPVLRGGPVEPERGFVLHRSANKYDATLDPGGEIKVTLSTDILGAVARGDGPEPMRRRARLRGLGRRPARGTSCSRTRGSRSPPTRR